VGSFDQRSKITMKPSHDQMGAQSNSGASKYGEYRYEMLPIADQADLRQLQQQQPSNHHCASIIITAITTS
jgi:hypothetical protein